MHHSTYADQIHSVKSYCVDDMRDGVDGVSFTAAFGPNLALIIKWDALGIPERGEKPGPTLTFSGDS